MKKLLLAALLITSYATSFAQQDAALSMYMFNLLHFNPAYAGSKEGLSTVAIYRHQWDGIVGAPRTLSVSAHNKFKNDHYNWGVSFKGDQLGLTQFGAIDGMFAYKIKFNSELRLQIGVSVGTYFYQIDTKRAETTHPNDIVKINNPNKLMPNFGVGAFLYSDKFFVGASIPHLVLNSFREGKFIADDFNGQFNHMFAEGGLILGNNDNVKFRPSMLVKYATNAPISIDANLSVLLSERYWLGASYRFGGDIYNKDGDRQFGTGNAIVATIKFMITQQFEVGYAYDYSLSKLSSVNNGTHEIMLGYSMIKGKTVRFVTPRYVNYF